MLGCDGANSMVRASIGSHMYGLPFQQDWVVIDVDTDAELDQWEGCHQLCSVERAGTYMRVGQTRYRWEFRLLDGETAADYQTIEHIEPLIKPWLGDTPADQLRLVRVTAYTFRAQVASRWRDRNVFVLGDAAHLTPPFVGQGMAAGLRDALNLSWKVAGVLGKTLPESVLDTYEQERKAHAAAMILMAVSVGAAMTGGGRVGDVVRKVVFPRLAHLRLPGTRTSAADGVAPGLHKSALVVKSRTPGQLAGTLCPNPVLRDGLHFDQVVGNRFALVTSSPLSAAQQKELESRGAAVVSVARDSQLGSWLKQGRATAAIVRPDGAVMQAGRNVAAICDAVPAFSAGAALTDLKASADDRAAGAQRRQTGDAGGVFGWHSGAHPDHRTRREARRPRRRPVPWPCVLDEHGRPRPRGRPTFGRGLRPQRITGTRRSRRQQPRHDRAARGFHDGQTVDRRFRGGRAVLVRPRGHAGAVVQPRRQRPAPTGGAGGRRRGGAPRTQPLCRHRSRFGSAPAVLDAEGRTKCG